MITQNKLFKRVQNGIETLVKILLVLTDLPLLTRLQEIRPTGRKTNIHTLHGLFVVSTKANLKISVCFPSTPDDLLLSYFYLREIYISRQSTL